MGRGETEDLKAAAKSVRFIEDGKPVKLWLRIFSSVRWEAVTISDGRFWTVGDIDVFTERRGEPIQFRGVRFLAEDVLAIPGADPSRLPERFPRASPSPPYRAKRRASLQAPDKVTIAELREWFPGYARTTQDFRASAVKAKAQEYFGDRPVTRQPIRDLIGEFEKTGNRGKPKR